MLVMVVNERQRNWDLQLPHVEFVYNNLVSAATGLAPSEINIDGLPRLPLTVLERSGVVRHQSLARGHLIYFNLQDGYIPTATRPQYCLQATCPYRF